LIAGCSINKAHEAVWMGGLIGSAILAGVGLTIWASLYWVIAPLNRAAKNRRLPIQFGLADLLCLFVLVQLPVGAVHWVMLCVHVRSGELTFEIMVGVMAALLWWNCTRMLSRAGVHTVWQRCVVLTVVLPGIITGPVAAIVLPLAALDRSDGWALLALVIVIAILYALGRFTRAIVAWAKEESQDSESDTCGKM
jgi:hypothetical protein